MNYNDEKEKGVVILKWVLPRNNNGKLTHFGIMKCRTKDLEEEVTMLQNLLFLKKFINLFNHLLYL